MIFFLSNNTPNKKTAKFGTLNTCFYFISNYTRRKILVDIINSPNVRKKQRKQKKSHCDKNEQNFWIIKIEKSINSVIKGRDAKEMKESKHNKTTARDQENSESRYT